MMLHIRFIKIGSPVTKQYEINVVIFLFNGYPEGSETLFSLNTKTYYVATWLT